MLAITSYQVVLAVHIMAVVLAFGVTFSYPILYPFLARNHPQALGPVHEAQERIGKLLIVPASVLALLTGLYLAIDRELLDRIWVQIPMAILIILLGLSGAFFSPAERRAAELARNPESPEYQAVAGKIAKVGTLSSVLVLVAIFFMTAKPGGY